MVFSVNVLPLCVPPSVVTNVAVQIRSGGPNLAEQHAVEARNAKSCQYPEPKAPPHERRGLRLAPCAWFTFLFLLQEQVLASLEAELDEIEKYQADKAAAEAAKPAPSSMLVYHGSQILLEKSVILFGYGRCWYQRSSFTEFNDIKNNIQLLSNNL